MTPSATKTLERALKAWQAAGWDPPSVQIGADGKITLTPARAESEHNPADLVRP